MTALPIPDDAAIPASTPNLDARRRPSNSGDAIASATPMRPARRRSTSPKANRDTTPNTRAPSGSSTSPKANEPPSPTVSAPSGDNFQPSQHRLDTHVANTGLEHNLPESHECDDTQSCSALGDQAPDGQDDHPAHDTQIRVVVLFDPVLDFLAASVEDLELLRIATANRYRIATTTGTDKDGEARGFGYDDTHPAVASLHGQLDAIAALEHGAVLAMNRQFRTHPLYPWVKDQKGLGLKTVARLLCSIGDPYWNQLHQRPRTIGELFAYCGVDGPGRHRKRGQTCNWNATARKRLWIMTKPIIQGKGPWRDRYDQARVKYAEKTHTEPCAQCGKKGKPALEGTEWRAGHKDNGARRLVMREILRGLWTEAKRLHEAEPQ